MTSPGAVCALVANRYTTIALADGENRIVEVGTLCNIWRPTFVLRCPQGTHACETLCRGLMSRGMRSRNSMLARFKRGFGYKCKGHSRYQL
jgi:hypothetical protein